MPIEVSCAEVRGVILFAGDGQQHSSLGWVRFRPPGERFGWVRHKARMSRATSQMEGSRRRGSNRWQAGKTVNLLK